MNVGCQIDKWSLSRIMPAAATEIFPADLLGPQFSYTQMQMSFELAILLQDQARKLKEIRKNVKYLVLR